MRHAAILFLVPAIGGCATTDDGKYPSLLPRAIESRSDAEPEAQIPVAAPDPALDARIDRIRKTIADAGHAFDQAGIRATDRAKEASHAAAGSDAWLDAQTALGDLDGRRAEISAALSDLEQIAIDRAAAGQPDYPAIAAAQAAAQTQLDGEAGTIARLQAMLAPG